MEPALRKRMFRHSVWMEFRNKYMLLVDPANACRPGREEIVSLPGGALAVIKVVRPSYGRYPPTLRYYVEGVRLTPAKFADEVNRLLTLAELQRIAQTPPKEA
jgi:hypothetical protein